MWSCRCQCYPSSCGSVCGGACSGSCGCGSPGGGSCGCGGSGGGSTGGGSTGGGSSSLPLSAFPIYVSYPAFFRDNTALNGANTAIFTAGGDEPAYWPWG